MINGANRYARASVAMMAVPESAEGSWGDVKRQYIVGGNWKSNGNRNFIDVMKTEFLVDFNPEEMDVCVAPTNIHIGFFQGKVDKRVSVMSQDVSQYGEGAYTGNVTA